MSYLLDTSTCSDIMDDRPDTLARLAALPDTQAVQTCSIVRGELLFGIERMPAGKKRDRLARRAEDVLRRMRCEAITQEAANHYAVIKRMREKDGRPLDENDLWIAATSLALGATLVTRDMDFSGIKGLAIENWSQPA